MCMMEIDGFLLLFFFFKGRMIPESEIRELCMRLLRGKLYLFKLRFFFLSPENNGIHGRYDVVLKGVIFVQQPNVNDFSCL